MAQIFVETDVDPILAERRGQGSNSVSPPPAAWRVATLADEPMELVADYSGESLRPRRLGPSALGDAPLLLRAVADKETWLVMHPVGGGLRINGHRLATGIRVLRHRDELRLVGSRGRLYFSLERQCRVEAFEGNVDARCPRCHLLFDAGSDAVRCVCGVVYHQSDARKCWDYGAECMLCRHPTDLSAGFQWIPSEPRHG